MTTPRELHRQAMELAQDATTERERGNLARALELYRQALPIEVNAASQIEKTVEAEPTRSILYLSAATLAYHAEDISQAKRLVGEALAGSPPPRVEADLFELLEHLGTGIRVTAAT